MVLGCCGETWVVRLSVLPGALFTIADRLEALAVTLSVAGLNRCLADLQDNWSGPSASAAVAALRSLISRVTDGRVLKAADGRLIVALGDPVTSPCVATYIPGAGTTVASSGDELSRAAALRAAAGPDTCVIMWLDYEAPSLLQAVSSRHAAAGAAALRSFQGSLVSNHDGPIRQLTVIGHSYGAVVAGIAERDGALLCDDIVALGSPSLGVRWASELRDPTQVWVSTAANDPIRLVPGQVRGATSFASAPFGHGGYFHPDNPALATLAGLVSAQCPRVE